MRSHGYRGVVAGAARDDFIDMSGPWETFQDSAVGGRAAAQFELFTVAEWSDIVQASGGLMIKPTYTYQSARVPNVVVVPAHNSTDATLRWLRRTSKHSD